MEIVWFVVFTFGLMLFVSLLKSPRIKGAMGERRVRHALRRLNKPDYHLICDVTLQTARGTTQLDHVLLSPFGVFVIETKNMNGWIFGSADQAKWTQMIGRRKYQFQNPLRQNYAHVKAIEERLNIPAAAIHSLVAFTGAAKAKTALPENVIFTGKALLAQIQSKRTQIFSAEETALLVERLKTESLPDMRATRVAHIKQIKGRKSLAVR